MGLTMTLTQFSLFMSMIVIFVHGFSFADPAIEFTTNEESRIYGGSNAKIDKHRYIANLHVNGTDSETFCGGTLISPNFILTAGHCLGYPMFNVYASLGSKHKMGGGSPKSEMIGIVEAYRHPSYQLSNNFETVTHDLALLKLETPSKIKPVRLAAADGSDNKPGSMAYTFGWGMINNETYSDILQTVDVKILTNAKCAKLYADAGDETIVDKSVICAGTGNGKDACYGDHGGPLIVDGVVVGVVSSGPEECGILPRPYARISNLLAFIDDILNGKSSGNSTALLTAGKPLSLE